MQKRTNFRRELLYRLLGGRLVHTIRYPRELVKLPVLLVVAANCLWKALRPLGLSIGKKYWKTGVEAWISRHVELYYITTCPTSINQSGFSIPGMENHYWLAYH